MEEFAVGDCVVCFGEVDVDRECWLLLFDVSVQLVDDGL